MKTILNETQEKETGLKDEKLRCDGLVWSSPGERCKHPIAYIDAKGYVYCEKHGILRSRYMRCVKLRAGRKLEIP